MGKRGWPPGPQGNLVLGNLPELRRGRLAAYTHWARQYGDIFSFRVGPRRVVFLNHPDLIEQVLVTRHRNFRKHFLLRRTAIVLGNGLLTSEGDFWLRQRRLAQPAFHRPRIAAYGTVMVDYAERAVAGWRDGDWRDTHADMMRLTLEIVAKTLFDADVAADAPEVGAALEIVLDRFTQRVNSLGLIPETWPTPANRRLHRAVERLDAIVYRIIAQRRASREDRGDLLSMLLQARDEADNTGMTDRQLRDEVITLFLAGHETTAIALSWTWYLLSGHPEVEAKLHAELDAVLGDRPPTVADLPRLRYADAVVTESMRLYPPAWIIGREAINACEVGGWPIPAGTTIVMSQWVTHRDPRFFDRPDLFEPERWLDGLAKRLPKFAYFPFGGGPRLCIGQHFAQMEATLLLATIARRYRLRLDPTWPVEPWPSITLRPRHGLRMQVLARPTPGDEQRVTAGAGREVGTAAP